MPSPEFETFEHLLAGQYALEREIGRGGMGIVYLGRDLKLDRPVAIKTLPPHLASDPTVRERFLREARTAAALSHPNIVPIYRADELEGHVFFAMGYVNGVSVAEQLRTSGRLDPRVVLREMSDVAEALDYAHGRGVIHRDVKAENILIESATGAAMVTDFGIARLAEAAPLTATGQVLGTVYYMSPEQVGGGPLDGRSDLYSLGVVGFFALTGQFPFDAPLASAVLVAQVTKAPPPVLSVAPDAPRGLAEIIDRCLAKDPGVRYQSGAELAEALRRVEGEVARDAVRAGPAPEAPKLVSEGEAQAIWNRAAELQAMTGLQSRPAAVPRPRNAAADAGRTSGYDLTSVRDAGIEAGIPAQYVEHAMIEHGLARARAPGPPAIQVSVTDVSPEASKLLGAPSSLEFEAVVSGEMPEADFDLLVDTIRMRMGRAGAVTAVGRSLTWNAMGGGGSAQISVLSRRGRTTVRAVENLGGAARRARILGVIGGVYLAFPATAALAGHLNPVLSVGVGALSLVGVLGAARYAFARTVRKARGKLHKLTEELAGEVRHSIEATTPPPSSGEQRRLAP